MPRIIRRMLVVLAIVVATVGSPPWASADVITYTWHTVARNPYFELFGWFRVPDSVLTAGFISAADIEDFQFVTIDFNTFDIISYTPSRSTASTSQGGNPDPGTGAIPINRFTGVFTGPGGMGPPGTETLGPYLAITANDSSSSIKITTTAASMDSSGSGRWTGYGSDPSHNHGFWTVPELSIVPEPSTIVQVVILIPMGLGVSWWRRKRALT
jgi:hypothetical protein